MPKPLEIPAGSVFGRLTVIGPSSQSQYGLRKLECRCSCGQITHAVATQVKSGHTKSCGCMARDPAVRGSIKHGGCKSRTYLSWSMLKARCTNPKNPNFPNYGGRGIKVCDKWLNSYPDFLADMGERPPGTSIDRIDNAGNYEPGNCRWATKRVQQNNRAACRYVDLNGERLTVSEAGRKLGFSASTIRSRLYLGWPLERALSQPRRKHPTRTPPAVSTPPSSPP